MADSLQTDLIVQAIAKGFAELRGDLNKTGTSVGSLEKKITSADKSTKSLSGTIGNVKTMLGGFALGLNYVGQAYEFAQGQAEKLGRTDVSTNIDAATESFAGLLDVLVQIPVGGRDFLQWLGDGAEGAANLAKMLGALAIQTQLELGLIDQAAAEQQIYNLVTDEAAVKAAEQADAEKDKTAAVLAGKKAAEEAAKANQAYAQALAALNTAIAGQVGANEQDEGEALNELLAKREELRAEIEKYTAANGQAIPPAENLTELQNEQALATHEYEQAIADLNQAQGDLATSQAQQLGLDELFRGNILKAQVAIDDKRAALEEANKAVADASGGVANYSGYLKTLQSDYDETNAEIEANAAKHELASRRIILAMIQQELQERITLGVISGPEKDAALLAIQNLTTAWGLADSATTDVQNNIDAAFVKLSEGGAVDFALALDEMRKPLDTDIPLSAFEFQTSTTEAFDAATEAAEEGTTPAIDTLADELKDDLVGGAGDAKKAVDELGDVFMKQAEEGGELYAYNIGIQSLTGSVSRLSAELRGVPTLPDLGGVPGAGPNSGGNPQKKGATGLDMIVPPGFAGDTFPVYASSGERVRITNGSGAAGGGEASVIKLADTVIINNPFDWEIQAQRLVERVKNG